MSQDESAEGRGAVAPGKWSWVTEDWLAVVAGLALIALVLTGILPDGLVP
ncbi:hypothetical protein JK358_03610 [Nocardia sp. 2]|uniref:Uncharacterized protein n=1 Tax=Nocardia acididurans TaxID=2802282 RepID=A0ABS1LYI4_9NOCA|nr:hypothetical protein [Nocardia acididurans]MBL1073472.1 hypothetical protein [Nocardia acididurans]